MSELKIDTLVVKVASRCNLNCSYCYVYNVGDDGWRRQPAVMSAEVVQAMLNRVRTHCLRHGIRHFSFVFHGGEPLLCDEAFFRSFIQQSGRLLLPVVEPAFVIQTNGTLLTERWCALFAELGVGIGISLDGPPEVNDRSRVDHAGRGSYAAVRRGIDLAGDPRWNNPPGLLTVISLEADPIEVYEHYRELGVGSVNFLFPDATHDRPPARTAASATPYADWLIRIFDRWLLDRPALQIRMFEEYIRAILGKPARLDTMGTAPKQLLVIETDGGIEPVGTLKICGNGFTSLGANVLTHDLDAALRTDLAFDYHLSGQRLCATCQGCGVREICGGGYLAWRYSSERRFDNPSVYCHDLMKLISHIQNRLCEQLPQGLRSKLGITPLDFEQLRQVSPPSPRRLPVLRAS